MSSPEACDPCLVRSLLLEMLAPYIELVATRTPGSRSPELLRLADEELVRAVAPGKAPELLGGVRSLDPQTLRQRMRKAGCWACCRHDEAYPEWLRSSPEAPAALIARGEKRLLLELDHASAVTVVGSRRASRYGAGMARELGRELGIAGLTVVSGMAFGVDSAAHEGALDGGGATIAVLGCGPDVPYPATRHRLHRRIVEEGIVISELPPGMKPWKWTFPARNRIMAAIAWMTVIVEAAKRSGSLITAEMAADLGRQVGAVPGEVTSWLSAGTNELLHEGAHVIRDAQDVLDVMLGPGRYEVTRHGPPLGDELLRLLEVIGPEVSSCGALALAAEMPAGSTAAGLAQLELMGYVRGDSIGRYARTLLEVPPKLSA